MFEKIKKFVTDIFTDIEVEEPKPEQIQVADKVDIKPLEVIKYSISPLELKMVNTDDKKTEVLKTVSDKKDEKYLVDSTAPTPVINPSVEKVAIESKPVVEKPRVSGFTTSSGMW